MPDTPNPADLIQAILDELVAEINDPRTLPQERNGIRIAHVIVRRVAERRREESTWRTWLGMTPEQQDHQRLRSLAREKAAFALYPIMELIAAGELANAAIAAVRQDQLQADLAAANAEIERLRGALASAREAALREAIEAVREGYDPEFTTNAETAIRALLTTPAGDAKADPVVAAEVHE